MLPSPSHSRTHRSPLALALAGVALLACGEAPAPPPRDPAAVEPPVGAVDRLAPVARADGPCLGLAPRPVALRGVIRQVGFLGPPGYGETPAEDRRDSVPVLLLPAPLVACPDPPGLPAGLGGRRPPAPAPTARVQLVRLPGAVDWGLADTVIVYGTLRPATWGWHYTPAILEVDSIPALRPPSRPRAATRGSPRLPGGRLTLRYT